MDPMNYPTLSVPLGLVVLGLLIWSLVWVYKDAGKRGKHPILVCALVLLVNWPFSLLLWYVFRPESFSSEQLDDNQASTF